MTDVYGWVLPKDQKDTYQVVRINIKETFRRGKRTHYLKVEVHSCYLLNMQEGNMAFSNFFSRRWGGGSEMN